MHSLARRELLGKDKTKEEGLRVKEKHGNRKMSGLGIGEIPEDWEVTLGKIALYRQEILLQNSDEDFILTEKCYGKT